MPESLCGGLKIAPKTQFHCIFARRPLLPALSPVHRAWPPRSNLHLVKTNLKSPSKPVARHEDAFQIRSRHASCPCARLHADTQPGISPPPRGRSESNRVHSDALNNAHRLPHTARRSSPVAKPPSRSDFIALVRTPAFRPLSRPCIASGRLATTCAAVRRPSRHCPNRFRVTKTRMKI
ncbi:hypothetical protein K466DRAFT_591940 [Polyporus arcularius HHB13444]|uniref:Uncharacterized protein n=1 Tax=Polyporus arcularius HHB13444 TaxID=1314778 RepID=A0A5C3NVB7_9APHY|nr:hypothetical protein K466DRAFT_591940 [Polyporus arcularius HHB13444]